MSTFFPVGKIIVGHSCLSGNCLTQSVSWSSLHLSPLKRLLLVIVVPIWVGAVSPIHYCSRVCSSPHRMLRPQWCYNLKDTMTSRTLRPSDGSGMSTKFVALPLKFQFDCKVMIWWILVKLKFYHKLQNPNCLYTVSWSMYIHAIATWVLKIGCYMYSLHICIYIYI